MLVHSFTTNALQCVKEIVIVQSPTSSQNASNSLQFTIIDFIKINFHTVKLTASHRQHIFRQPALLANITGYGYGFYVCSYSSHSSYLVTLPSSYCRCPVNILNFCCQHEEISFCIWFSSFTPSPLPLLHFILTSLSFHFILLSHLFLLPPPSPSSTFLSLFAPLFSLPSSLF